jgi:hypothetical protein
MVSPCATLSASGSELLDLGHANPVSVLKQSGDRVLSEDASGHWVLWDTAHRTHVASGDADPLPAGGGGLALAATPNVSSNTVVNIFGYLPVDLAAGTLAVPTATSVTLRSSVDGHVLSTVSLPPAVASAGIFGLAEDGSYLWTASTSGLNAWSTSGKMLVNLAGDYSISRIYAAPTELRVGQPPQPNGNNAFELDSVITGRRTKTLILNDAFESWFLDGSGFMTAARQTSAIGNDTVVTFYSSAGVKQNVHTLQFDAAGIVGQGAYFWTLGAPTKTLQVFSIAGGDTPVWISPSLVVSPQPPAGAGNLIEFADSFSGPVELLDLSGPTITQTSVAIPGSPSAFDADFLGNWAGSFGSLVYDSVDAMGSAAPRSLDCGRVFSIAGSTSGRVAIATEAKQVLTIDLQAMPQALVGSLGFAATRVALSSNGTVLVAGAPGAAPTPVGTSLRVFDLSSGTNPWTWTFGNGLQLVDFSLSLNGATLAWTTQSIPAQARFMTRRLASTATGVAFFSDSVTFPGAEVPVALSPDGTLAAISDSSPPNANATTGIFKAGRVVGTAQGYPIGWIDNAQLLLKTYVLSGSGSALPVFGGDIITDPQGHTTSASNLPPIARLSVAGPNQIYDPDRGLLYDLGSGSVIWQTSALLSDIAGPYAVVFTDHRVLALTHP